MQRQSETDNPFDKLTLMTARCAEKRSRRLFFERSDKYGRLLNHFGIISSQRALDEEKSLISEV